MESASLKPGHFEDPDTRIPFIAGSKRLAAGRLLILNIEAREEAIQLFLCSVHLDHGIGAVEPVVNEKKARFSPCISG